MARIRTIKPEFFTDYKLYEIEKETQLPIRVAYAGLWTQCDREGRFEWIPEQLKIGVLPYDNIDFARVLDALVTRGLLVKYASKEGNFGCVKHFKNHQIVNNREKDSTIPEPPPDNDVTRESRVEHAPLKGRERNNIKKTKQKKSDEVEYSEEFLEFYELYPRKEDKKPAAIKYQKIVSNDEATHEQIMAGAKKYVAYIRAKNKDDDFIKLPSTWLNKASWNNEYQTKPRIQASQPVTIFGG